VSGATSITRKNLLSSYILTAGVSNTGYRLLNGFKLNRIEIYSMPSTTTSTTVALEWLSNYGPSTEVSDTSTSSAYPAHLITSPPLQSLASFWSMAGSNESEQLFIVTAPLGSIIDIYGEMVLVDGTGTTVTGITTGTANNLYTSVLDGPGTSNNSGAGNWSPVSVVSIN
jgi:hypothetical protein